MFLLQQLIGNGQVKKKKFPVFQGTRTLITMTINPMPDTNLSHFNSIHSLTHYFLKTNFNIVFPSTGKTGYFVQQIPQNIS